MSTTENQLLSKETWIVSIFPSFVQDEEKYMTAEIKMIQILNRQREIYLELPQEVQKIIRERIEWAELLNPNYGHCSRDPHRIPSVGDLIIYNVPFKIFTIKFEPEMTIHYNRYGTALMKVTTTNPAIKAMSDNGIKFDAFAVSRKTDNGNKYILKVHNTNELLKLCTSKTTSLCFGFMRVIEKENIHILIPMVVKILIVKWLDIDLEKLKREWTAN